MIHIKPISILIAAVVLIAVMFTSVIGINTVLTHADDYNLKSTVVIDAGHGGKDPGAVSDSGIYEKDLNLDISLLLSDICNAFGYNVILTRKTDISIDGGEKFIKNKDIKNRVSIANSYDNTLLVSIHMNKFTDKRYSGAQVFYSSINGENKAVAENFQSIFKSYLQPDNNRVAKKEDRNIYLLNNVKNPSVLVECGFLSNDNELENLCNSEYKLKLAMSLFKGIDDYYSSKNG